MANERENFIDYDYLNPSPVFSKSDIEFVQNLNGDFLESEKRAIWYVEEGAFNKTTKVSSFTLLPGVRAESGSRSVYFGRYTRGKFLPMMKKYMKCAKKIYGGDFDFGVFVYPFRITSSGARMFYPVAFRGALDVVERCFKEAGSRVGADIAEFKRELFVINGAEQLRVSSLIIDTYEGSVPSDW